APIDLAPPKTYLPPPPPPEIPAVPAASVSPVAVEPAALGSAAPGTVAAPPEAPLPESGAESPSPEDVWNRGESPEEFMSPQPSPRGLCEACEDALSQLRQLTVAFLDE